MHAVVAAFNKDYIKVTGALQGDYSRLGHFLPVMRPRR